MFLKSKSSREYTLIRSRRKTIALQVNSKAELVVRAPNFAPKKIIEGFIAEKTKWLDEKIAIKKRQLEALEQNIEPRGEQWYKDKKAQARKLFHERVDYYEKLTGLKVSKLKLSSAKTRWGSCSRAGNISLVWRLVMAPIEIVDYVIVHEIIHLRHPNHSKAFWDDVAKIIPDYKTHRRWLRDNGYALSV